jgi:hypothetical protein
LCHNRTIISSDDSNFGYELFVNNGGHKMEIIDISGKGGACPKCHRDFNESEKRSKMPICAKCIMELVGVVKGGIDIDSIEEFSDNVSDFADFISSSSRLMGLDDIVVVQVCFNIYMDTVREVADRNPTMARKIFKDTRRFIDIELERLEDSGESNFGTHEDLGSADFFEEMMGNISKMMKDRCDKLGRNDVVDCGDDNISNKNVDNTSGKDGGNEKIENGSKKDGKSVSKRIKVD